MINPDNAAGIACLFDQEAYLIEATGGLFPERTAAEMSQIVDVLNIGSGAGAWVLEVARRHPEMEVTGIDTSRSAIAYARAHARVRRLRNAHFAVMDTLKPLDISTETFDLVHMCTIPGGVPPTHCVQLLPECMRILRPGGIIRIIIADGGSSNASAFETLSGLCALAMQRAGFSFSATGRTLGPLQMMAHLLRRAGYRHVCYKPSVLDFSSSAAAHNEMYQNYTILFKLAEPFLLKMDVITAREFTVLYENALLEMLAEDFCAAWTLLTIAGEKPY